MTGAERQKRKGFEFKSSLRAGVCAVGVGGRTHSPLALVVRPVTTHLPRDGAPFLFPTETPPRNSSGQL